MMGLTKVQIIMQYTDQYNRCKDFRVVMMICKRAYSVYHQDHFTLLSR